MATTIATPKQFSIQQVFHILLRNPSDKSIVGFLKNVKTTGLENAATMVYPQGGRGNTYIGNGFSHSQTATLNVTTATWNTEILALQNGTVVSKGTTQITEHDTIEYKDDKYVTKFTALGVAGAEIGYIYIDLGDGTPTKAYEQSDTAAPGLFEYDPTTKEITFDTADLTALDGATISCAYDRATETNAQKIQISGNSVPATVLVSAYGLANDICSGDLFPCLVEGRAVVDQNYTFDLAADGEPAVQSLNMEFVMGCNSDSLYTFTIYTDEIPA